MSYPHQLVTRAIRSNKLIRQSCEICKNPKTEAHHDDYSKPLDVRWLCRIHHKAIKYHPKMKFHYVQTWEALIKSL